MICCPRITYEKNCLNNLPNPTTETADQVIYFLIHENPWNRHADDASCDDIRRPMYSRSYPAEGCYQAKDDQDDSESEIFLVLIHHSPDDRGEGDAHAYCRMIRRETAARQKVM